MGHEVRKRKVLLLDLQHAVAQFLEAERSLWELQRKEPPDFLQGLKHTTAYAEWLAIRAAAVKEMMNLEEELELLTERECG